MKLESPNVVYIGYLRETTEIGRGNMRRRATSPRGSNYAFPATFSGSQVVRVAAEG